MLASAKTPRYEGGQFVGLVLDPNWDPPPITGQLAAEIRQTWLPQLEARLAGADRPWLGVRVQAFLAHWYVANLPVEILEIVLFDWVVTLASYPAWVVQQAIGSWLDDQRIKPTPSDIAGICRALVSDERQSIELLQRLLQRHGGWVAP